MQKLVFFLIVCMSFTSLSCTPKKKNTYETASTPADNLELSRDYCRSISDKKYLSLAKFVDNTPFEDTFSFEDQKIHISSAPTYAHAIQRSILKNWQDIGVFLPSRGCPLEIHVDSINLKHKQGNGQWAFNLRFINLKTQEEFKLLSYYNFPSAEHENSTARISAEKFEEALAELVKDMNDHSKFRALVGAPKKESLDELSSSYKGVAAKSQSQRPRSVPYRAPRPNGME